MRRDAAGQAGFTLMELVVYLALFGVLTATLVASDIFARRLHRNQEAVAGALAEATRLFSGLAADFDHATAVRGSDPEALRLEGAATWDFDAATGTIRRDGKPVASGVAAARFERDPAHPRLVRVTVALHRGDARDPIARTFRRSFALLRAGREEAAREPF